MEDKPHQFSLRRGRFSISGYWYSITKCIEGRENRLILDPYNPLEDTRPSEIVINCFKWLHIQKRWFCKGYVIMPDHIHIIFILSQNQSLKDVMSSFGRFTARELNKLQKRQGNVWQHGFYDHCIRNEKSYIEILRYILENPVRKGYVDKPDNWPFCLIDPPW